MSVLAEGRELGFLGPGDLEVHVEHALGFATAWKAHLPRSAVDLGSGAGVPGLVLATVWRECDWVLVDSSLRRTRFLLQAVEDLGLARVSVVRDRAELAGHRPELREHFDAVVARGFGRPAVVAECSSAFLRLGGRLVVSQPPDDRDERWPAEGLAVVGLVPGAPVGASFGYRVFEKAGPCPARYPRRTGVPAKRPLF